MLLGLSPVLPVALQSQELDVCLQYNFFPPHLIPRFRTQPHSTGAPHCPTRFPTGPYVPSEAPLCFPPMCVIPSDQRTLIAVLFPTLLSIPSQRLVHSRTRSFSPRRRRVTRQLVRVGSSCSGTRPHSARWRDHPNVCYVLPTEESSELEKAREEWEAVESAQPGKTRQATGLSDLGGLVLLFLHEVVWYLCY